LQIKRNSNATIEKACAFKFELPQPTHKRKPRGLAKSARLSDPVDASIPTRRIETALPPMECSFFFAPVADAVQ
jgi:hypothetical protein